MYAELLEFLDTDAVRVQYGLQVRPEKCWVKSGDDMRTTGAVVLGSHVSGDLSENSQGSDFATRIVQGMEGKLSRLRTLSTQSQLLILRLCFAPRLIHLVRTMHPRVIQAACAQFDQLMEHEVQRLAGQTLDRVAKSVIHLPIRMGGLGIFHQEEIAPNAIGASFLLSHHVLTERHYHVSDELVNAVKPFLKPAQDIFNLSAEEVLQQHGLTCHMQRRMCEAKQEQRWEEVFTQLNIDHARRVQLVENMSPLARPFLNAIPSHRLVELSDPQCAYGLCRTLLLFPVPALQPSDPLGAIGGSHGRPCSCCHAPDVSARHHLQCNKIPKTRRHDRLRNAMMALIKQAGHDAWSEVREPSAGTNRYHDIVYLDDVGNRHVADVTVGAALEQDTQRIVWPLEAQIGMKQVELANAPPPRCDFAWEDHSQEVVADAVWRGRALRLLCYEKVVDPVIHRLHAQKVRNFEEYFQGGLMRTIFHPLPFTAGGGVGSEVSAFMSTALALLGTDTPKKIQLRKNFRNRCSVALVIEGYFMARLCS